MSIAATPYVDRASKYEEARQGIEQIVSRYGRSTDEASDRVARTMSALADLVLALEARRKSLGWTKAA
jgi:hypothetical protein